MQAPALVLMLYDAVSVAVFMRWHFPNECGRQAGKGVGNLSLTNSDIVQQVPGFNFTETVGSFVLCVY
jgi:hypothetical protein